MRALASLLAVALLAGCAGAPTSAPAPAASASSVALLNAGFEQPPYPNGCPLEWSCVMHAGVGSFRYFTGEPAQGRQSACMERVTPEPWALLTTVVTPVEPLLGKRLRLTFQMRRDRPEGDGAGPFVTVQNGSGRIIFHDQKLMPSTRGWQAQALEFRVPPEGVILEVGLIVQGGGRACMDDVRLEIL